MWDTQAYKNAKHVCDCDMTPSDFTLVTHCLCAGLPRPATAVMDSILRLYAEVLSISVAILLSIIYFILYILWLQSDYRPEHGVCKIDMIRLDQFKYHHVEEFDFSVLSYECTKTYPAVNYARNIYHNYSKTYGMSTRVESCLDLLFLCFPTLTILYVLCPTLAHLYDYDLTIDVVDRDLVIDVIGRQWYWSYSVDLIQNLHGADLYLFGGHERSPVILDSLLVDSCEYRLLAVDNELLVPLNYPFNLNITASDVIHSFSLPHWGLKVDAIPGRIAKVCMKVNFLGTYRGQCSESCGAYHGFMPIVASVIPFDSFFMWYLLNSDPSIDEPFFMSMNNLYRDEYEWDEFIIYSFPLKLTFETEIDYVCLMSINGFDFVEIDIEKCRTRYIQDYLVFIEEYKQKLKILYNLHCLSSKLHNNDVTELRAELFSGLAIEDNWVFISSLKFRLLYSYYIYLYESDFVFLRLLRIYEHTDHLCDALFSNSVAEQEQDKNKKQEHPYESESESETVGTEDKFELIREDSNENELELVSENSDENEFELGRQEEDVDA